MKNLVQDALREDLQGGDITTRALFSTPRKVTAKIFSREVGVLCGIDIVKETFSFLDSSASFQEYKKDGDMIAPDDVLIEISADITAVLSGERVALNFLQRLSGIATKTFFLQKKLRHAKLYDTRKTTPLLREIEKYAVKCGGGYNHRMGLFDEILIKENHVKHFSSLTEALIKIKEIYPQKKREIEVETFAELQEALQAHAEIILLDNMTSNQVKEALIVIKNASYKPIIEVSGKISEDNITDFDLPGVDRISVGALTHSVKSIDMSLLFVE